MVRLQPCDLAVSQVQILETASLLAGIRLNTFTLPELAMLELCALGRPFYLKEMNRMLATPTFYETL